MVQRTTEKNIALTLAAAMLILHLVTHGAAPATLPALHAGAGLLPRLAYHILHASWPHLLLNTWCLLALTFKFTVTRTDMLAAYLLASSCPSFLLATSPVVGLSAFNYALMGILTLRNPNPALCILTVATAIAIGAAFPHVATSLHLYAYTAGLLYQLLNTPRP
ncbi:MAG: rhomboid family intramembrane serine protease [Akkermansia sp.]